MRAPLRRRGSVPPRLLSRAALALRRRLHALADAAVPPQLVLFEQAMGVARTALLHAAARLRVADRLAAGPRAAVDLAEEAGCDADALHRGLRALAAGGVFRLRPDGRFENTRLSAALREAGTGSMRGFVDYLGSPATLAAWADVDGTVATGREAFQRVHGVDVWTWFARHREEGRTFAEAMARLAELDAPGIAAAAPFRRARQVCDVAGGRGAVLEAILERRHRARGVLLDTPEVAAEAEALLAARGLAGRVRCVAGDFFQAVPGGCDVYLLRDVLHDWDDEACLRILASCRRAAAPGARVVIAEILVDPAEATSPAALADVQMLLVCRGGRQRSAAELRALLARAGFEPGGVHPLPGITTLVVGAAPG